MNRFHAWIIVSTVMLAPLAVFAEDPPHRDHASVWMRKKLDYSRAILEGLAIADFDKIAHNARAMRDLTKLEEFVRGRSPAYRTQLQTFLAANDELLDRAQDDNVEGAALAFTQITISCVNCHKQLRATDKPGKSP